MSKYDEAVIERGNPDNSQSVTLDLVGEDKRVLDVGCATGYLARALTLQGCVVVGVDNDAGAAEKARDALERLVVADLEEVDLADELAGDAFDAIVFGDVLEHLRQPQQTLRQARRLLRPGGVLVTSTPNVAHGDVAFALLRGRWDYRPVGLLDETHLRFFTLEGVRALLLAGGFVPVEVRRVGKPLFATEIGVSTDEIAPEVVDAARRSPEHETYQFVIRSVADDADGHVALLAARAHELDGRVAELARTVGRLESAAAERDAALADTAARLALAEAERDLRVAEAERAADELVVLRNLRTLRYARRAREVYGRLRALR